MSEREQQSRGVDEVDEKASEQVEITDEDLSSVDFGSAGEDADGLDDDSDGAEGRIDGLEDLPGKRAGRPSLWQSRRNLWLALIAGLAVALLALVGVIWYMSRDSAESAKQPSTQEMLGGKPPADAVAAAGGSCKTMDSAGRQTCRVHEVQFYLLPDTWESKAGERERECNTGMMTNATKVLTNGSWMAYPADADDFAEVAAVLSDGGAPSRQLGYCEYEAAP